MSATYEKVSSNKAKLSFTVPAEQFEAAMQKAYLKNRGKINVPGFRRGKAPRKLIETMYGESVFYDDAFQLIFPDLYDEAVKENNLQVVDQPEVDVQEIGEGKDLVFSCEVFVRPDVTLGDYKGLTVNVTKQTVTDADIDARIEQDRKKVARQIDVEGALENGDTVKLNYMGTVDGVAFEGGTAENQTLTLGSGQFIPGFEEQIVGHEAGEEFDVNVTFPEDYHAKELAGKAAVFKVKLNEVQYKELPVADDEFAKDVSEYDTLDEFKASIRKNMEEAAEKQAELEVENALVDQLVATLEGDIPPVMIETRIDEMVRDFDYRLSQQGLRLADYLKYIGGDEAKFREGFKEQAEKQVKMRLALEAVAKAENIEASEEDFENEVKRIADTYKMEVEKVRSIIPVAEVKKDLAVNKAIDFIKSKAEITAKKAEEKSE